MSKTQNLTSGKQGVYGGFQSWIDRAGRFRSLGDGQVDFKSYFLSTMVLMDGCSGMGML